MADAGQIREVIEAAAEGAGGGVATLRAAGIPAELDDFAVEVRWDGERAASVVVSIAVTRTAQAAPGTAT
jgi:hypothetical protein